MKMKELFVLLLIAFAITWVIRDFAAEPKGNFAARHPKAAKVLNGGARLAKWAGLYFLLADDLATPDKEGHFDPEHSPTFSKDEEKLYGDGDFQHFAENKTPPRKIGADGFPVINHGFGW